METLYIKSDSRIVYGRALAYVNGVETVVSTGTCEAVVKDSSGAAVGDPAALTYKSASEEWDGFWEDPAVDTPAANDILVEDAEYTIEITFAGSGSFAGIDDFRELGAIAKLRGAQ